MSREQVITRHPRDYTVQILHSTTNALVGTGIVVSSEKIVTCAHVVVAAGVNPRLGRSIPKPWEMVIRSVFKRKAEPLIERGDAEVGVYFPLLCDRKSKERRATVVLWFAEYEDDVVVLQLVGGPAPMRPEQIARLGTAEPSEGNPFRSYGYSPTGANPATRAEGTIMGTIERAPSSQLQADLIQLRSSEIDAGMSGAGVLDTTRNLVVGLIAERFDPGKSHTKKELGYGVDSNVLTFDPFNLPVQSEDIPLEEVPLPRTDIEAARAAVVAATGNVLHGAPAPLLGEWVGRQDLLLALNTDWVDPACHVSELIGFGGEGKSSLVRHWLDQLLHDPSLLQPDGVFWWNCYDNRSVDALFEAALQYLSSGSIDPRAYPSSFARAHFIAGMLTKGRFLFIFDGLEVLQYQEGDAYGSLMNPDLRELLSHFADPRHDSFCLLASRAPVIDLLNYTSFHHHDVERLSPKDGHDLLRKLGVTGTDAALDKVVKGWEGHALTLSLLGSYLVERHRGDVTHADDIALPLANESHFDRVQRVLRRYDEHLMKAEKTCLTVFSAFRIPAGEVAFSIIFSVPSLQQFALSTLIAAFAGTSIHIVVQRLETYRLLLKNENDLYTLHPLVRSYYIQHLHESEPVQYSAIHQAIAQYYIQSAGIIPDNPTLADLVPVIEAVHHLCSAGDYNKAAEIMWNEVSKRERYALGLELGALETATTMLADFFPNRDTSLEPQVGLPGYREIILNAYGYCLMAGGKFEAARTFFTRLLSPDLEQKNWPVALLIYRNLAELDGYLGALTTSDDAAKKMQSLAANVGQEASKQRTLQLEDPEQKRLLKTLNDASYFEVSALSRLAWNCYLRGNLTEADNYFEKVRLYAQSQNKNYLWYRHGVGYADYLRRRGQNTSARQVIETNLEICKKENRTYVVPMCYRVIGDLDAENGAYQQAMEQYHEALRLARSVAHVPSLIEALLAQGRLAAQGGEIQTSLDSLNEALNYAIESDYRSYEVDGRVALALTYLEVGNLISASYMLNKARHVISDIEYYWGNLDILEVSKKMALYS